MSITKSQTDKIGSIFKGNHFTIPKYQRKYSWTDNETKALWNDINESIGNGMNHFVGTLCFKENKSIGLSTDTEYEVIDGQQRLTTIFLLLSVLIEKISDKDIRDEQQKAFIGAKEKLKLLPQGIDGEFLTKLVFDFKSIKKEELTKRSQKLMYAAKEQFLSLAEGLTEQEITKWIIYVRDNIEVLVFNVENQAQAVKMFSIINDRGLPLRILDKTKSILMLYSTLYLGESLNSLINDKFEKIFDAYDDILVLKSELGILGRFEENTIFTHHYYSAHKYFTETWNNRDGANTIFSNIKNKCELLRDDKVKLEEFIKDYVSDFSEFSINYSSLLSKVKTNINYEKPFRFLEFTATLYPVIVRLHMQNKFDDVIDLLESIEVRVYKLKGTNPIADMYWLSSRLNNEDLSIDEIKNILINFGERFMGDHTFKTYLGENIYGNGSVKYILEELNNEKITYSFYKSLQVEHIFSRDPNFDVSTYGFDETYDYEKNRIGNLSLIEESLNKSSSVRNNPPINKVSGYLKSNVKIMRDIAGIINAGDFDKEKVDIRREEIIRFCIERFSYNK
jgi:uncharacterized protein with ParB-like and HNH nuclease domain